MNYRFRKESDRRKFLASGQDALTQFANTLPELPELGAIYGSLGGRECADALVLHRIRKKFQVPVEADAKAREAKSIRNMLDYDSRYVHIPWRNLGREERVMFLGAQSLLSRWLSGFRTSYSFRWPSNETYVSSGGDVSLVAKLSDLRQWTVSADCIDYAFKIVWANQSLRKMVKMHFRREFPWRSMQEQFVENVPEGKHVGYHTMRQMFKALVTIVGVDRIAVVPKDNESDRVITCVPFWNMVCQLSIANDLKNHIKMVIGYDLNHLQDVHRGRIADPTIATIDLSKASDSNWWERIKELFPAKIVKLIGNTRTGIVEYENDYYPLNMMAPMGCGYTFEIMTLTLLAYARTLDDGATVFGDDIIIKEIVAVRFAESLKKLGWLINENKSFFTGSFRESCGGFYHRDMGYLVSYDIRYPTDEYELIVIINKIRRIVIARQISDSLRIMFIKLWIELVRCRVVDFRYPSHQLDGEMIDFEATTPERAHRVSEILISQQLQSPVAATLQAIRKITNERRPSSWERSFTQLVRLLMPGLTSLNMKETKISFNKRDFRGLQHQGLVLYSPIRV